MQYILNNLTSQDNLPNVLVNGTKTLSIEHRSIKIIDSYSFLPMALEKFSTTFGLVELKKGFFPHLFNKIDNFNYIGSWPNKDQYGSEFFTAKKKEEFDIWYDSVKDKTFNFQKELHEYCWSDVELLTQGALEFRKHVINSTKTSDDDKGVDPFCVSITIASMCNYIFRRNHMSAESIGIIPENGYNCNQITSNKCQYWLKYIMLKEKINIKHAKNGGEYQIGKYFVDGYCSETDTIYEFDGCLWHGCLKCQKPNTWNSIKQQSMYSLNQQSKQRIEEIKKLKPNSKIIIMNECDFKILVDSNDELKEFIKKNIISKLYPRDALYGGRTEAIRLFHECEDGEDIDYYDATSLYPSVQKEGPFPVGHPNLITENFDFSINAYFGLIKCTLLPPRQLYLPVIPARINKKLMFALCCKCATEFSNTTCEHQDQDRIINGTWVTLEVYKAVELGYKIIKIEEVWHWNEQTNDIFKSYINFAIKGIKI